ncbi:hypothetical protein GCM10010401_06910 [Rarobacter faecitabidus]|uniref:Excisionase family DNA binding protein n=1 Tax=Rarobacter faecitabidus TaxID=13243 RepID=A0A542ZT99_RARFA|nr:helix-turn-helix domain-containing protein [Rarobacter faecitabidus]TQL63561.1 excisionase family DNA binding protein [Rarobacter faecitabidus]
MLASSETISPADAGRRLGRTARTMTDMARSGEIPHVRIGRSIRFTEQIIADYIAAHTVGSRMVRTPLSRKAHRRNG